ncbi:aminopeptidase P family protein [Sulfitobacter mediterraneus]|uniref:M24 family metallopeptidase n=1 Tax=Sulfitobacter mediterraneus TaxID=83219 RepID=UPI0019326707|nr:Xaa-Pro peptidase family protein [Sulfitobacter mediterraneus]MBM1634304.1 aminopeptidase P family protein [Sulfitobacter mediterraneus]MBM1642121.1 aminopeptidase P family protein [Sulfitobacter mediterraneus]MBM1646170.1 aminopeptidase P family protein [Sulfitobacter mediterraneus]MBM1650216.1 aminopeptidase P family protein [Sulfitobacter mediterraneus]MBM1654238.1 aminopeptidase P family protein [Sulfitobacter mediterraneus]
MTNRGFEQAEFEARLTRAQMAMAKADLDALLLTTEAQVRYFTGYLTRFWESPTRPWFLIVPASGKPVAVIPSIGAALMGQTWVEDIRSWSAPDLADDGVSLLGEALRELTPDRGRIGVPDGHETHLRMPLADLRRLEDLLPARQIVGDAGIIRGLRMVKSTAEIAKIENACAIAGRAFGRVPEIAAAGVPLDDVFRRFQMLCLEEGADWVPYLAGGAEQGGYTDVISPARAVPLVAGDVLMLDTGMVWDGYFCDYDRNWSVGPASTAVKSAHAQLIEASDAAFDIARPGATAADLFHAMNDVLTRGAGATEAGRLGHGLGMSLTEWPSLIAQDHTPLEAGMVLTLEPGIAVGGKIIVHEENIVITDGAPRFISPRIGPEISTL